MSEPKTEISKKEMVAAVIESMKDPVVARWYEAHLTGRGQGNVISDVMAGILNKELTLLDGLCIVWLTGKQWDEKFEGVP